MATITAGRRRGLALPRAQFATVWRRDYIVARHLWVSSALMPLVEPLLTFLVIGFGLGQFVELEGGGDYIDFIAPGMIVAFAMWQALFACTWPVYLRLETQQVHEAMLATTLEPEDIAAGEIAWGATMAAFSTFYVLLMAIAFGAVDSVLAPLVVPVGFLHGVMIASMALAYTATMKDSNALTYFFTIVALPMFWFGDVFVPAQSLPEGLRIAAWFVPTTHSVGVVRDLLSGDIDLGTLGHLAWVAVVAALFFVLAMRQMRRRLVN